VMLILLALPVIVSVAAVHRYIALYAPTNLLVRHVRTREPRWSTVGWVAAVATWLLLVADALAVAVARGAPGWLNLVLLVVAWNAIKLGVLAVLTMARAWLLAAKRAWPWMPRRHPTSALGKLAQDGR